MKALASQSVWRRLAFGLTISAAFLFAVSPVFSMRKSTVSVATVSNEQPSLCYDAYAQQEKGIVFVSCGGFY